MAKIFYFVILDTTKPRTDWDQLTFVKVRSFNDISGHLLRAAKSNKTDINNLRLFVAENKTIWDDMANKHYTTCKAAEIEKMNNAAWWDLSK